VNLGRVTTDPGESLALNILIASERFSPSVGGVETVTALLSEALADAGHKVVVITNESGEGQVPSGCQVVRRPAMAALIRYYRAADSVILHGMAVRLGWPLFWRRCRAVVVHHMRTGLKTRGATTWPRAMLSRRVRHAAVSHALACAPPKKERIFWSRL
jgi:glycogen(starch) synthase